MDLHKAIRAIHTSVVTINGSTEKTIIATDKDNKEVLATKENLEIIDLYNEPFSNPKPELITKYQNLIKWSNKIYFISLSNRLIRE